MFIIADAVLILLPFKASFGRKIILKNGNLSAGQIYSPNYPTQAAPYLFDAADWADDVTRLRKQTGRRHRLDNYTDNVYNMLSDIPGESPKTTPRIKGLAGEEAVAKAIGLSRNIGPGRITVPGTGRGGFRIPDFGPEATLRLRGSVIEVKNVQRLSGAQQVRDLLKYARDNDAVLEIFTNAPKPTRGVLREAIDAGYVTLKPIPDL